MYHYFNVAFCDNYMLDSPLMIDLNMSLTLQTTNLTNRFFFGIPKSYILLHVNIWGSLVDTTFH